MLFYLNVAVYMWRTLPPFYHIVLIFLQEQLVFFSYGKDKYF